MRNKKLINTRVIQAVSILAALTFSPSVLAECVQSNPEAEMVFTIDATNGCDSINDHYGCHIKDAEAKNASCEYGDAENGGFEARSEVNGDGSLGWFITQKNDDKPVLIDVAIIGGATKGNNCGYSFELDVKSGSGGDCKRFDKDGKCADFQNFTSLDVCTDLEDEAPPPPPPVATTLQSCQGALQSEVGLLDETGIRCPLESDGMTQKNVIVCNLEVDEYAWGAIGANQDGISEQVCCRCGEGDTYANESACFISETKANEEDIEDLSNGMRRDKISGCIVAATVDPTQEVILQFTKDRGTDPCTKIVSGGKTYKYCWQPDLYTDF